MDHIFLDIGLMLIVATIFAFILRYLKQPLIPGYILAGILLGPVLGVVTDLTVIKTLSEIGIAFLLFIVGLELDIKKLKDIGGIATFGAVAQVGVLFLFGLGIGVLLGFPVVTSVYLGLILAFSSTMVVIKLLSDKNQLDTVHGRIVIGILLMQDIIAILALSVLKDLNNFQFSPFFLSLAEGIALLVIAMLLGKYVFPRIFKFAARHQEVLFLASISVCLIFAMLFTIPDFSIAIGAFVAGITLGSLPYNVEIVGRVKSLRDFFSVLFFTAIGAELATVNIFEIALPLMIFTIFTVFLLPIITTLIVLFFGYKTKTAFLAGLSLSQVSEFGLIIAALGLTEGHISQNVFSITILLALITMASTAYFIKYDDWLYRKFKPFFKQFERSGAKARELSFIKQDHAHEVVLVGLDRLGYSIFRKLRKMNKDVLVVDYNPDIIKKLLAKNIPCVYGDIADGEIIETVRLSKINMLVSTIPDRNDNVLLLKKLKSHNHNATVIVTSYSVDDALELYELGADYVIVPHYLGGEHVSILLEDISDDLDKLLTTKLAHIKDLRMRNIQHPHHR